MSKEEISIPGAPACLPEALQAKWKDAYVAAFKEAKIDFPEDATQQRQVSLREANRLLRPPVPTDYRSAMAIPAHLVHSREHDEKKAQLKLVTIDGKKYRFPLPGGQAPPPATRIATDDDVAFLSSRGYKVDSLKVAQKKFDEFAKEGSLESYVSDFDAWIANDRKPPAPPTT